MEVELSGTQSGHETIPEKPPDLDGGAKSFSISGTSFQGQISFRDKVLGTKPTPPIREKIDLLRENEALGKNIGYTQVNIRLKKVWHFAKGFELMDVGHGFFMVKFDQEIDRMKVMNGGPWMIFDHYLTVRTWSPSFVSTTAKIDRTLVWARIPDLNVVFYDESFLLALASTLGTPIKVDMNTVNVAREQVTIPSCLNLHDDVITNTIAEQQDNVDVVAETQQEEHNHAVGVGEHNNGVGMSEKVTIPSSFNLHADYVITNTIAETVADTQQEEHNNVVGMAEQHLRTDNITEIHLVESDHEDEMHRQHLSHSQPNPASLESDLQLGYSPRATPPSHTMVTRSQRGILKPNPKYALISSRTSATIPREPSNFRACGCYGHVARNCLSKNNVQMQSQRFAEHDNIKVSVEDIPTNMIEDGEHLNRIISNVASVTQVTRSSPHALRTWRLNMHGNSEGIIDLGHMRDLTTLGSLENHKVMTVPENIGKEKQVDAPNKTGDVSDSMKNKRARKSEEIHAMINPLTLQDREGQLNREKNGSRTLVQSRKIRGKGEGPSRIGRNLPTGAFWEKGKEKLGLSPLEKDFVFGQNMLDDSYKNIIQHNQANNTSSLVASFWNRLGYCPTEIVEANGHAGGIWVLTSGGNFSVSTIDVMAQCAIVEIKAGSQSWFMSLVYASPIPSLRYQL
uniref:DUF4283 domain-containing protein n=1 Tax=Populus alba TaxID=43335 RepID=A0A4U5Q5C7_POPAL|nr:hypothetical protein D5086_0000149430 [Populus alba]